MRTGDAIGSCVRRMDLFQKDLVDIMVLVKNNNKSQVVTVADVRGLKSSLRDLEKIVHKKDMSKKSRPFIPPGMIPNLIPTKRQERAEPKPKPEPKTE